MNHREEFEALVTERYAATGLSERELRRLQTLLKAVHKKTVARS